jgi:hypothetical protein
MGISSRFLFRRSLLVLPPSIESVTEARATRVPFTLHKSNISNRLRKSKKKEQEDSREERKKLAQTIYRPFSHISPTRPVDSTANGAQPLSIGNEKLATAGKPIATDIPVTPLIYIKEKDRSPFVFTTPPTSSDPSTRQISNKTAAVC